MNYSSNLVCTHIGSHFTSTLYTNLLYGIHNKIALFTSFFPSKLFYSLRNCTRRTTEGHFVLLLDDFANPKSCWLDILHCAARKQTLSTTILRKCDDDSDRIKLTLFPNLEGKFTTRNQWREIMEGNNSENLQYLPAYKTFDLLHQQQSIVALIHISFFALSSTYLCHYSWVV